MIETEAPGVADVYPLSPTQAGMIYHSLADPDAGVYLVQVVYELQGDLHPETLAKSMQLLVDRNEMLRSAFVWEDMGRPLQIVHGEAKADTTIHDWPDRHLPPPDIAAVLAADRARGVELGPAPHFRTAIVQSGADELTLVWTFHHALLDGWSGELLIGELLAINDAVAAGIDAPVPQRRPFRDFIAWLDGRDAEADRAFWSEQLAGFTSPSSIRDAAPLSAHHRAAVREVAPELTDRLREFARSNRLTLNTVVQGAWSLLLSRYTGRDDVVFGVTTSGRPPSLIGVEEIIGMFLTTVPCRVRLDADTALVPWLAELQAAGLRRSDHEHTPLVDIQRWSDLPAGTPLFDSILAFENVPRHEERSNARVRRAEYLDASNYPLAVVVDPVGSLTVKVVSDPRAFDDDMIDRLIDHLLTLLRAMVEQPGASLDELSMLPRREIAQLAAWNDTSAEVGDERLIPERIAAHARTAPDTIAAVSATETLTYAELWERASALSTELRRNGVAPNMFVGVHLDRSIDMIVAVVGILQAGAAYLPLDPTYPAERLSFMLEDAAVAHVITASGADEPLTRNGGAVRSRRLWGDLELVVLDRSDHHSDPPAAGRPAAADDLAYMIYTSGSTGRPNGVPIDHARLVHSTQARFDYYEDQPEAFLLLSSLSFDSSVVGIFWTLAAGGRLVLPGPGEELDAQALGALIAGHRVTHTLCLPALYRVLLEHLAATQIQSLRTVIVAGEACPPDLPVLHAAMLPAAALFNEYGPTEAAVWCSVHRCEDGPVDLVPIGRPIANTQLTVLDRRRRPTPIGVAGEIYVGGRGVAAGYHARPELTEERFVRVAGDALPLPATDDANPVRLFRTGDIGRHRPDGVIEFLGRIDDQVKIRGFRVELGEVEAALRRHPDVAECAVLALTDPGGDRLRAYVEVSSGEPEVDELRSFLAAALPPYMVPGSFTIVAALPRLPNGKIDRAALAAESTMSERAGPAIGPRDEVERAIADIWAELLPDTTIGVHDDFFQIGGHSILAVALIERIRRSTGKTIRLSSLLEAPTVAGQAALVREVDAKDDGSVVAVKPAGSRPPLYLVPPAGGTSLMFYDLGRQLSPDQPLFAFEPLGTDGATEPQESIPEMAGRYLADLKARQPTGPYRLGGSCMGAHVAWEIAHQLRSRGEVVETVVAIDATAPDNGPDWTTPPQRVSSGHPVRAAFRHLFRGSLLAAVRRRWRIWTVNRRFRGLHEAHLTAQSSYRARPLDVDLFLLQSTENADEPTILQRWSALSRGRVESVVIPGSKHRQLGKRIGEMASMIDEHLSTLDRDRNRSG